MSDDGVLPFPKAESPDFLIGPFEYWKVIVEGRMIPRLTGYRHSDGRVTLVVDGRFMADFPEDLARQAAWLIAQALAIGEGYPWLGALTKDQPFAPLGAEIGSPP